MGFPGRLSGRERMVPAGTGRSTKNATGVPTCVSAAGAARVLQPDNPLFLARQEFVEANVSKKQKNDNAPAGDDALRGGTEGGGNASLANQGTPPGGTNALTPSGGSHAGNAAEKHSGGTRTDDRFEQEEMDIGARKPSAAVAKEKARDRADVDTTHGFPAAPGNPRQQDETDPTGQSHSTGAQVTEASTGEKGVGERK